MASYMHLQWRFEMHEQGVEWVSIVFYIFQWLRPEDRVCICTTAKSS